MDHTRRMLETAREDAQNHARVADRAALEATELRVTLEEATEALKGREAKAEEEAKVLCRSSFVSTM